VSDLVCRLREAGGEEQITIGGSTGEQLARWSELMQEAANEVERLRGALRVAKRWGQFFNDGCIDCGHRCAIGQDHTDDCELKPMLAAMEGLP
jgi:hypothetical protein